MARKKLSRHQMLLNAAKRQMIESGDIDVRNDTRPVPESLKELYDEINREDFDSQLPEIPVTWNANLTRVLGRARSVSEGKGKKRGTRKGCQAVGIEIKATHAWTDRFLRKVMAHEMCHVWAFTFCGEVGHGPQFWKKMRKLGYQKGHRFPNQQKGEGDKYCV